MTLGTGDVVWHTAPFKTSNGEAVPGRPWLLVSNDDHPFHGSEYVALGMTTTARQRAISVEPADWTDGGLSKSGYVSPWYAMTLKHDEISHRVGTLEADTVDQAVAELFDVLGSKRPRR